MLGWAPRTLLWLFNLLSPVAALGLIARFAFSPRRRVLLSLPQELRERAGRLKPEQLTKLQGRPVLWIHAASAGEVGAVEGLLERIKRLPHSPAIVLTCSSSSGRKIAQEMPMVDLAVLAPFDAIPTVEFFIAATRPYALLLVETEIWPNMIAQASQAGLKIGLVNGRLSEKSLRRYSLFSPLIAPFLKLVDLLAVQTETDAAGFRRLGVAPLKIAVAGNMKFDLNRTPEISTKAQERLLRLGWSSCPLFVAGSTHPEEEEKVLEAFLGAKAVFPALKLVLAPRHVDRAADAAALLRRMGLRFTQWTQPPMAQTEVLLLDTLGVLTSFYRHAFVSFVGGTLVPVGGHNLLEPALAGSSVLFGPNTSHTRQSAELLCGSGCATIVSTPEELREMLEELLADPSRAAALGRQAQEVAQKLQGATERSLEFLRPVLAPPPR